MKEAIGSHPSRCTERSVFLIASKNINDSEERLALNIIAGNDISVAIID